MFFMIDINLIGLIINENLLIHKFKSLQDDYFIYSLFFLRLDM